MRVHKETPFILLPVVLVLVVVLFIISSLSGSSVLVFLFAMILSLAILSFVYLKYQHDKVSWSIKKYQDSSSIDETFKCYIEVTNDSALPLYHLKLNIESRSDKELVFIDNERESSILSMVMDLPAKSQKTIVVMMKGKSRGNHQWSNFEFLVRDPLILQSFRLEFDDLPQFKVIPRILKLNDLKLKSLLQGYKQTNSSLYMDEASIIGTKDYENESFRHIHWLATAKENKLLAKKYQKVHGDVYSIFLNIVGAGQFHLRKDMEELIEYAVSVCLYLIKEGCKVELWVNYSTEQNGILKLENDLDRSQVKKIIGTLAMIHTNGVFFSTERFFQYSLRKKDSKSLGLIIGTPPVPNRRDQLLHIKQ
ncbi:DUF58 domain-containing protein [Rossellomorea aquimaris]|uniref:DUF58 domain-containing protein n=1 Tax=Rossellomorea aquimaris TaxID=189382 RepID=UPI0009EEF6F0|nr:DUF58 domain-containing protein [Rossellomorea aquimaris]